MIGTHKRAPFVLADAPLHAWATNDRISRLLIEHLDEAAWRAEPVGSQV